VAFFVASWFRVQLLKPYLWHFTLAKWFRLHFVHRAVVVWIITVVLEKIQREISRTDRCNARILKCVCWRAMTAIIILSRTRLVHAMYFLYVAILKNLRVIGYSNWRSALKVDWRYNVSRWTNWLCLMSAAWAETHDRNGYDFLRYYSAFIRHGKFCCIFLTYVTWSPLGRMSVHSCHGIIIHPMVVWSIFLPKIV
jgi:hypothetical protein